MTRRDAHAIAKDLEARAAKMKADADRRRSVASDPTCGLMYDCEKELRKLAAYTGQFKEGNFLAMAEELRLAREDRWAGLKARQEQP